MILTKGQIYHHHHCIRVVLLFCYTSLHIYSWGNLKSATWCVYHHTHTLTKNHICGHICEDTPPHTGIRNSNINILLSVFSDFFYFSKIFLFLRNDCRIKTAWNQLSQISINTIKYVYINTNKNYIYIYMCVSVLVGWLVGWILWHINLSRLFNAKSIFM